MLVMVRKLVHLRYFLKAAVLHHFPSRVTLDAVILRYCLFPIHFSHFATSIELACGSNSDACAAAFLFSLTAFLVGRCLAPLPFQGRGAFYASCSIALTR